MACNAASEATLPAALAKAKRPAVSAIRPPRTTAPNGINIEIALNGSANLIATEETVPANPKPELYSMSALC